MITFLIVGILAVFFAYYSKLKRDNWGLLASFLLIFFFLALRYNYGNDYTGYHKLFYDIHSNFSSYFTGDYKIEKGWVILNIIFFPFGFYSMIFFLATVNSLVYYKLIVRFVEKQYYWFAVLIYYFNTNIMLIQLSAMRQNVAIILFICSLDYIIRKKYVKSFLLVVLSIFFHSSSLLLIPIIIIIILLNFRVRLIHILLIEMLFISLFIFGSVFKSQFAIIVSLLFSNQYAQYDNIEFSSPSLINGFVYFSIIFIILKYYNDFTKDYKFFIKLFIVGVLIIPVGYIIPLSGRLAFSLFPLSIIIYPKFISLIKSKLLKNMFVICVISVFLVRLVTFFYSETYGPYYSNYLSIFYTFFEK